MSLVVRGAGYAGREAVPISRHGFSPADALAVGRLTPES